MKVVISDAKKADYEALFSQLHEMYPEAGTVDSLPTYYRAINTLVSNGTNPLNKFFRLPLEEPYFEVDMDTRTITVPSEFANYGLGVSGDANAEMVFFQVPRFYDNVDLYALVQETGASGCWVQWQNNTSKQTGNSKVIFTDAAEAEVLADKNNPLSEKIKTEIMYLGWLITNDMTAASGTLEFSLRFFKTENGRITYSISTQKASCPIKSTLNLDVLEASAEDMTDVVYTRPLYSGVINSMAGASARITQNLDDSHTYNLETSGTDYNTYYDPEGGDDTYKNGVRVFRVVAESPDGGAIVYQWYNGADMIPGANSAAYAANIAGSYNVRVGNYNEDTGTRWVVSPTVIIPAARAIKFSNAHTWPQGMYSTGLDAETLHVDVVDRDNGGAANGTLNYTWKRAELPTAANPNPAYNTIENANTSSYKPPLDAEGWYTCTITNYLNNTTSDPITTENPAIVRAEPDQPVTVVIRYNAADQIVVFDHADFPTGSKSQNHEDEWKFQWINSITGRISEANGGKLKQYSVSGLAANADNAEDYVITLEVQHVVWDNNTPGARKAGRATTSNAIRLHVSGTGTNKVITEVAGA